MLAGFSLESQEHLNLKGIINQCLTLMRPIIMTYELGNLRQ